MRRKHETHLRESTVRGVGGEGPLSLFLLSSWHESSDNFGERRSQGSLSAGSLGHLARANVPLRHSIVVAVPEDSDAFSAWQTQAARDGRTACSPARTDNWWQKVSTAPVQQGEQGWQIGELIIPMQYHQGCQCVCVCVCVLLCVCVCVCGSACMYLCAGCRPTVKK